jgi:hypothetical protein
MPCQKNILAPLQGDERNTRFGCMIVALASASSLYGAARTAQEHSSSQKGFPPVVPQRAGALLYGIASIVDYL